MILEILGISDAAALPAEKGRDGQQGQQDKQDETSSPDAFIAREKSGKVEAEHDHEAEGWEDAHEYVQMRPRLRN
jgi:hypothetical protein